jgi:hypothetical protein
LKNFKKLKKHQIKGKNAPRRVKKASKTVKKYTKKKICSSTI